MRIGLIARADSRGLGVQTKGFYDHMHPERVMVVDCPSVKPLPIRRDWYRNAMWVSGFPKRQDYQAWLPGLDVVFSCETFYHFDAPDVARRMGVRTVLQPNFEFLDRHPPHKPDLYAVPSMWRYDEVPEPKLFLPVPVEIVDPPNDSHSATRFLHVVGRPAIHDRNGTRDLLLALPFIKSHITVTITCQESGYVTGMLEDMRVKVPDHVQLDIREGDVPNARDLYRSQDVLVMPRRFGGLCLPAQEAVAAGMPVIMPRIDPNDTWLPDEWLTPAHKAGSFTAKRHIDYYETWPKHLAHKIDTFAQDDGFFWVGQKQAQVRAQGLSWELWKPKYDEVLRGLVA